MLACFYIEGAGYQENMLPKYHKAMGLEVSIVTNTNDWAQTPVDKQFTYLNAYSIPVTVLQTATKKFSNNHIQTIYNLTHNQVIGLYEYLAKESPDIIFIHGCQHVGNLEVLKYLKNREVRLFVDQHGDYYNSPINTFKSKIVAKYFWGKCARKLYRKCERYWGVTPWRVQYLKDVYALPEEKTGLLIMGGDDEQIDYTHRSNIRRQIRFKYDIGDDEILIVTGGKIDSAKNIHILIEATANYDKVRLLVFGKATSSFEKEYNSIVSKNKHVVSIGWIRAEEVYKYFLAADIVVFPGTHSVLWEQAAACGVPCLVRHWEGMEHMNVNGNCQFIDYSNAPKSEDIRNALKPILDNEDVLSLMKKAAESCREDFLYSNIAKRSLCIN